jgi:putative NADPH-quinone reductase
MSFILYFIVIEVNAEKTKEFICGDLFEIDTIKSYPINYDKTTDEAKFEFRQNARPELTNKVKNMDEYDVIYLDYPNWWNTFPMVAFTFLES